MSIHQKKTRKLCGLSLQAASIFSALMAGHQFTAIAAPQTHEQVVTQIAKNLKPISNDEWSRVANSNISGVYEIQKGDSLFDISKRLFGDGKYWPKIWALNNSTILNPHSLKPCNKIIFSTGSGTMLPSVQVATQDAPSPIVSNSSSSSSGNSAGETEEAPETMTDADVEPMPIYTKKARSMEWKKMPRQDWEAEKIKQMMASRLEISVTGTFSAEARSSFLTDLKYFVVSERLGEIGQIESSPVNNANFRIGDTVILEGTNLTPGVTYDIVSDPAQLQRLDSDRIGYAYTVLGQVQVVHPQGDQWIGKITQIFHFAQRGSQLAIALPRIAEMQPVAAPAPIEGKLYLDTEFYSYVGQYQHGFVNLGTDDGIHEGMIFESFQGSDTEINSPFKDPTYFHTSNLQVIQVSTKFSAVKVLSGSKELGAGTPLRALTDVSRFNNGKFNSLNQPSEIPAPSPEPLPPIEKLETVPEPTPEPSPSPSPSIEQTVVPLPAPPVVAPTAPPAQLPQPAQKPKVSKLKEEPQPELPLPPMEAPAEAPNNTAPSPLPFDPTAESLPTPPLEMPAAPPTQPVSPPVSDPAPLVTPPATTPAPATPQARVKVKNELDDLDQPDEPLDLQAQKELKQLENYKTTAQNGNGKTARDTPLEMPPPPSNSVPSPPNSGGPAQIQMSAPPSQSLPPVQIQPSG